MERIWAPWRAEYFLNEKPKDCIFCLAASQKDSQGNASSDEKTFVFAREKTCFAILNLYPYSGGHVMVAPYKHTADLNELTEDELRDIMLLGRKCQNWLQRAFKPDGFNWGFNLGQSAGAGIVQHMHLHVVPRWTGDTNFMTVIGDKRVISEGLRETYAKLKQAMA